MFCTTCATYNPATLLRCEGCGTALHPGPHFDVHPSDEPAPMPNQLLRLFLTTVPILILVAIAAIVIRDVRNERAARATAYARAEIALAAGDYTTAVGAFSEAGDYRDAEQRRTEAVHAIEPYRDAYLAGVNALNTGNYDLAITSLTSVVRDLPQYEDAAALLEETKRTRTAQLMTDLATAEAGREWLEAERLLNLLLADDPGNTELLTRYGQLSRFHAPMVFARNGGIYVIGPDMLDERLITNEVDAIWPAWSPDRTRIAFFALINDNSVNYGLYVVNADGTGLTRLAQDIHLAGWPIWSPDGTRIAFSSLTPFKLNDQSGITSLHIVDLQTGSETGYTESLFMYATSPSWSPDGTRVAFISKKFLLGGPAVGSRAQGSLQVLDFATGTVTPLAESALPFAQYVTWSPQSNELLVLSSEVGSAWYQTLISTIDSVDLDTGAIEPITKRSQIVSYPIWSPDGSHYAFAEGNHTIQIRSIDGAITWINVPRDISPFLTWSPDSSTLIAPALSPGQASLIIPYLAGGDPIDLPLIFDYSNQLAGPPQWSAATPLLPEPMPSLETD